MADMKYIQKTKVFEIRDYIVFDIGILTKIKKKM